MGFQFGPSCIMDFQLNVNNFSQRLQMWRNGNKSCSQNSIVEELNGFRQLPVPPAYLLRTFTSPMQRQWLQHQMCNPQLSCSSFPSVLQQMQMKAAPLRCPTQSRSAEQKTKTQLKPVHLSTGDSRSALIQTLRQKIWRLGPQPVNQARRDGNKVQ